MHFMAYEPMTWTVDFHPEFVAEFRQLEVAVRAQIIVGVSLLEEFGPNLKRPHADTLNGSNLKNLKEYRFAAADGVWRMAYVFDPKRKAILLCCGDKSGVGGKAFYKALIDRAERRYSNHLESLK